eukprot:NODE_15_length_50561_cov_0.608081.p29 type:complete len:159 gc:universal NODE_15_length_50561_cov_0.608081:30209-29733(-)
MIRMIIVRQSLISETMDINLAFEKFQHDISTFPELLSEESYILNLVYNGNVRHFRFLFDCLKYDPKLVYCSGTKRTIIHESILCNNLDLLNYFLKFEDLSCALDIDKSTILHLAMMEDNLEIISLIVSKYPHLKLLRDKFGFLPQDYSRSPISKQLST